MSKWMASTAKSDSRVNCHWFRIFIQILSSLKYHLDGPSEYLKKDERDFNSRTDWKSVEEKCLFSNFSIEYKS